MLKWSECEAFSPGGIAGCRLCRHLLLSLPYISWECWAENNNMLWWWQMSLTAPEACLCLCFCFCFLILCIMFSRATRLETICRCRKPPPPYEEVSTKAAVSAVFISQHHLYAASLCSLQPKPIRHRAPGLKETLSVNLYVLTKRLTTPEERDAMWGLCVKHSVCSRVTEWNYTSDYGHTHPNQLCYKIQTMELFLRGCRNQMHPDAHLPPVPLFPLCRWVLITGSLCGAEMGL